MTEAKEILMLALDGAGIKSTAEDDARDILLMALEGSGILAQDEWTEEDEAKLSDSEKANLQKHDDARHGGQFEPQTMTCKFREKIKEGEKVEELKDEVDDEISKGPDAEGLEEVIEARNASDRKNAEIDDKNIVPLPNRFGGGSNIQFEEEKEGLVHEDSNAKREMLQGKRLKPSEAEIDFRRTLEKLRPDLDSSEILSEISLIKGEKEREIAFKRIISQPGIKKVNATEFHNAITEATKSQPPEKAWRVYVHPVEDYNSMNCYKTEGGSVFAINGSDIVSVCKHDGDNVRARKMMEMAVKAGGNKLDSFDGNHRFYRACGFEPISWCKFDPQECPDAPAPEDVIFYKYTGNKKRFETEDEVSADLKAFKGKISPMSYLEAMAKRDSEL